MKKYSDKQILSINDTPPSIPAFGIDDLAHAVDTFKPSQFNTSELPKDLPVYDKSTGRFNRFIKRGGMKRRVVSAPPMMAKSYVDKELPVAPNTRRDTLTPVVDKRLIELSKSTLKPRVVSGPPVPPKESLYDANLWNGKSLLASPRQKSSDIRWSTSRCHVTGLSPSYQLSPMKGTSSPIGQFNKSGFPEIPPVSSRLYFNGSPLGCSMNSDNLFSEKDEAWCYRDMY
ncbi:hypothetical protein CORT_0B07440 [Candida orthopsilosis Co 90-125]|uniref:Uncharacterized protein n=1 Tax=Candida orthopsilosis (strain 90-125) TaxID=1136231 RepID=H8X1P5_CANO9|nr:hypothetical protein CORT_0B07440 [Candida orthopsilosis Co 90-125]CCG22450.1 hypothetical protein CORT_0B07440 [Candida orthopsilosis Co 90-125]